MPVRKMTDEEVEKFFGGGLVFFGQKKPPPSRRGAPVPESTPALNVDVTLPAVDAEDQSAQHTARIIKGGRPHTVRRKPYSPDDT